MKKIDEANLPKPSREPLPREKTFILKVLAGSRGYDVFDQDADHDYRSVYVLPTEEILSLGHRYKGTHWVEDKAGGTDDTAYEIGHFLHLATKCNPTILNTLKAPVVEITEHGKELRELFPYFLDMKRCYDAFKGYGLNQRKKMLDNKDNRWCKYGGAYIRQLYYLYNLITQGDYSFVIPRRSEIWDDLWEIKYKRWSPGKIIDKTGIYIRRIEAYIEGDGWPESSANLGKVNEFLLRVRKDFWG